MALQAVGNEDALMGRGRTGGLTESQLAEELEESYVGPMPDNLRNASQTISWWQQRQADLTRAAAERRAKINRNINLLQKNMNKTIREVKEKRPFRMFY